MENASRAMIMAGGVFIAIGIISVALFAYTNAKGFASTSEDLLSASQIQSFNRFYTAFGSEGVLTEIKCIDAINILNRAIEDELIISQTSSKISPIGSFPNHLNQYPTAFGVEGDNTSHYIEKVEFLFVRDAGGKVSGVTIKD